MGGWWEGSLQQEGEDCHTPQAPFQAEVQNLETALGLGMPTSSCSDGTEEGDLVPT